MSYGFNNDKSKFPLGVASDLPDPTKTPMKIIGELQNQIIESASIENGATASKAYASGDYVCFQGALCKASKAISQGDTLSIGDSANDNLTLTDAAAEFARINSDLKKLEYSTSRDSSISYHTTNEPLTIRTDGYAFIMLQTNVALAQNTDAIIEINGNRIGINHVKEIYDKAQAYVPVKVGDIISCQNLNSYQITVYIYPSN